METTSPRLIKRIVPLTLMATRKDCGFARHPGEVSVEFAVGSLASRAMTKAAHECCAPRPLKASLAPSGLETAHPAIFRVFIVLSCIYRRSRKLIGIRTGWYVIVSLPSLQRCDQPLLRCPAGAKTAASPRCF